MRIRGVAVLVVVMLLGAACSNSSTDKTTSTTVTKVTVPSKIDPAQLKVHHPVTSKGVTDSEIRATVVASITNPLGTNYNAFADGIKAYFAMMNSTNGGIYGRKLNVVNVRDDALSNNNTQIQAALSQDNPFGIFIAALLFTGANTLAASGTPGYGWNINAEWANHDTLFPNEAALCFTCALPTGPWLAKQIGATKVGVLAYSVQQSSDCAKGDENSFKKFQTAKIVFEDKSLSFGVTDLSAQVSQMKKNGVQLVLTCMDLNGVFTLAKAMKAQNLQAVQTLPNSYDHDFMKANGKYFEGSYVAPQFVAFEHQPQIPQQKLFNTWIAKTNKKVSELTVQGWIAANQFVAGLKLAGPDFTQAKVVAALNQEKHFTADGMIAPIDWTIGHVDPLKRLDNPSGLDCSNWVKVHNSAFVPEFDAAGKPWVCFTVASEKRNDPTPIALPTPTNESFADTGL